MRSGLLALGAVAAILVGACGPGAPAAQSGSAAPQATSEADISLTGPVTVTIWHDQSGILAKGFDDLVAEFNKTNGKGITVKAEDQSGGKSYTGLYQKMLGAIHSSTPWSSRTRAFRSAA